MQFVPKVPISWTLVLVNSLPEYMWIPSCTNNAKHKTPNEIATSCSTLNYEIIQPPDYEIIQPPEYVAQASFSSCIISV